MPSPWTKKGRQWWLSDFTTLGSAAKLHARGLPGFWQIARYKAKGLDGVAVVANPKAAAPEIRIPLPATGRYSIALGLLENYCDRVLVKLEGQPFFDRVTHGATGPIEYNFIQRVWYKDVTLKGGEVLVLKQDEVMERRCGIAYIQLSPAPPPTKAEFPLIATADGFPCNNGVISFDEMMADELQFGGSHVSTICHGTDIMGQAQYASSLSAHQFPTREKLQEAPLDAVHGWVVEQLRHYEEGGHCLLRDSIAAAHRIGCKLYAYHRMGLTSLYAPMRMFESPFFDANPQWHCIDFDGTPISRMSVAFPEVRQYFLDHFRETVEYGADGVCLVLCRGWPLILFEEPVARAFHERTGRAMKRAKPTDPDLLAVRTEFVNGFMRDIRRVVSEAGGSRQTQVVVMPISTPAFTRYHAMDCATWAAQGWAQIFCPYPYGLMAGRAEVDVRAWRRELKGTGAQLCPILNRAAAQTPLAMLDKAEKWLAQGVDGLSMWDWDTNLPLPGYRELAFHLGSATGRKRLRRILANDWPKRHQLLTLDGIAVDRYHPGWVV